MDLPFEITTGVIDGLRLLNSRINEEITKKLIVNAVKQLLIKGPGKYLLSLIIISYYDIHRQYILLL